MTLEDERFERDLGRLLAASRASGNPAMTARVQARLAVRVAEPAIVRWLGRPVALAASGALFVASLTLGAALTRGASASAATDTTLVASLLGDDGTYGLPGAAPTSPGVTVTADSGEVGQ